MNRSGSFTDLERAAALVRERGIGLGAPLRLLARTASTNDDAKAGIAAGEPHGATWVADEQTSGRGRQGRTWSSGRGENLLVSTIVRPDVPVANLPPISIAVGLAAREAVEKAGVRGARLKWPNDVVVLDPEDPTRWKKIGGILVEASIVGDRAAGVVIGVGINVHARVFPEPLEAIATSVALSGGTADRAAILVDLLARLDRDVDVVARHGLGLFRAEISAVHALRGVAVRAGDVTGRALEVTDDGALVLALDGGGTTTVHSGEVHLAT